jgi:hypothetical protein
MNLQRINCAIFQLAGIEGIGRNYFPAMRAIISAYVFSKGLFN